MFGRGKVIHNLWKTGWANFTSVKSLCKCQKCGNICKIAARFHKKSKKFSKKSLALFCVYG